MTALSVLHAFATLALVGLIWTIQIVHYPLFAQVGRDAFPAYERRHARRITLLVGPLMLTEAITAIVLVAILGTVAAWIGVALVIVVWLVTAFVSVPCHHRLERGFDEGAWRRLVRTNWLRTGAWTARGVLALAWLAQPA